MKKTLKLIAIAGTLIATSANAKTEGGYLGLEALRSNAKVESTSTLARDNVGSNAPYYNHDKKNSAYGFGLSYKHAFNFNDFFIAPGISYEFLNNEVKAGYSTSSNDPFTQSVKLKSSLSAKVNLGYDITDKFAAYVPVGISQFYYDIETKDVAGSSWISSKKTGSETAAFIGFGLSYEPVKNWLMSLEYNKYQNLTLTSATATLNGGKISAKTNVDVMKLGVSYRF